jgi:uncharacterized membrane protein YcaP (DUF421 family)
MIKAGGPMFLAPFLAFFNSSTWQNMFFLDADQVTWAEKMIRPILVYGALIVLLRIFGKRELAQLNPLDLIVILLLSNTVQNAIIGNDTSLVGGVVGAIFLLGANSFFAHVKFRSERLETLIEGKPLKVVDQGKLDEKQLSRELLTESDLDIIAHENDLEDRHDIETLVIDTNGTFLVEGKNEIKDARFKREVLEKIDHLTKQLNELNSALRQT